jgi:hypothetical protein
VPFDKDGTRKVEATEDGKKIVIEETRGKEIVVRITQTVAGEERTTEIKARNAADLLRQDREAFQLYQRHVLQGGGAGAVINAQAFAVGGVNRQVQVTNVNGRRTVHATENGQQIDITDTDGKDITVRVTEAVNGKKQTQEYQAANEDELKQKHPEAAKLFEQYTHGPVAGFQVQAVVGGLPVPQPLVPVPVGGGRKQAHESIERALDGLAEARRRVEELKTQDNADKEALDKLVQELRAAERELFAAQEKLEQ